MIIFIKKQQFDKIVDGELKKIYREVKPYYIDRFKAMGLLDQYNLPTLLTKKIRLQTGQGEKAGVIVADVTIDITDSSQTRDTEPDKKYFCLNIKEISIKQKE